MTRSVLLIQRRLTEYRVPLFDALRARLAERGVALQVVYGTPTAAESSRDDAGELPWGIKIPCRYLLSGSSNLVWQNIPGHLIAQQDLIILPHENMHLMNYLLLLRRRFGRGPRLAYWGHGSNFQSTSRNGLRGFLKARTAGMVDWWFAYTSLSARTVADLGFPPDRITCLNNAVDTGQLRTWRSEIDNEEQRKLLTELGLQGGRLGLFLGGLYQGKRLEFLFSAADELQRRVPGFELLFIGDGPQNELVRKFAAARPWCRWVGARHGREKVLYGSLGTIMLNPGLVGLNILDSFCLGVPLITTDCGTHSPEIAYLEPGRNGLMTANDRQAYVDAAEQVLTDPKLREVLAENCRVDATRYSLDAMVESFCSGILQALSPNPAPAAAHVVVVWQRFLPYHTARIRRLHARLSQAGYRLTAVEVAGQDASYGFAETAAAGDFGRVCCFPGSTYHHHGAFTIRNKVLQVLSSLKPDVVFAPATPFPEGIAADVYRMKSGCRRVLMDDAWEHTDRRGWLTRTLKKLIHRNIDGAFVPAPSHLSYYQSLGFPPERVVYGVDVVDNAYFSSTTDSARRNAAAIRNARGLPENYFLFVGRFLKRKGLETMLAAYQRYRELQSSHAWDLVLVGGGPLLENVRTQALRMQGVHFAGMAHGDDLCSYYGLARTLIVPSERDPWGLVVNEGMASGLPVLVSSGCGSARTLVRDGENGWTFPPGDVAALAEQMSRLSALPDEALQRMGNRSREMIAEWSLDRFADGVLAAMSLPRREPGGMAADLVTRLWTGRVSVN